MIIYCKSCRVALFLPVWPENETYRVMSKCDACGRPIRLTVPKRSQNTDLAIIRASKALKSMSGLKADSEEDDAESSNWFKVLNDYGLFVHPGHLNRNRRSSEWFPSTW